MMRFNSIYVVGTFPDAANTNRNIRAFMADGMKEAADSDTLVFDVSQTQFYNNANIGSRDFCLFVGSVLSPNYCVESMLARARRTGAKTAIWLHDDPYEFDACTRVVDGVDLILTNDRSSLYHYNERTPVFHMPLAASRHFTQEPSPTRLHDFFFAGIPYSNRIRFFGEFVAALQVDESKVRGLLLGPGWSLKQFDFAIDLRVETDELMRFYNESLVTIYLGRDLDLKNERYGIRSSTPGPRLFEAAGAGACQIVATPGLEVLDYFTPDEEIIFVDDAREAAAALLETKRDRDRSMKIGMNAHKRVMSEHLYVHRAKQILRLIASV